MRQSDGELTDERSKSQEDVNNAEEVMPHGVDWRETCPVWMDEVDHIVGHRVDQLGTGRKAPDFESARAGPSRCGFGEETRVKHDAFAVGVGSSVLQVRMTREATIHYHLYFNGVIGEGRSAYKGFSLVISPLVGLLRYCMAGMGGKNYLFMLFN